MRIKKHISLLTAYLLRRMHSFEVKAHVVTLLMEGSHLLCFVVITSSVQVSATSQMERENLTSECYTSSTYEEHKIAFGCIALGSLTLGLPLALNSLWNLQVMQNNVGLSTVVSFILLFSILTFLGSQRCQRSRCPSPPPVAAAVQSSLHSGPWPSACHPHISIGKHVDATLLLI